MSKLNLIRKAGVILFMWATTAMVLPAQTFTTLYSFCTQGGSNCTDGILPYAPLTQGTDGNLYGATNMRGASGYGTVFSVTPSGALTTLHSFDYDEDGGFPYGGLVLGTDGKFYGTTFFGGNHVGGTIFNITSGGVLTTLHDFRVMDGGKHPYAGLVQGSNGDFYGTTYTGDLNSHFGIVFSFAKGNTLTTLHSFTRTEGFSSYAGLVQGTDGTFYGTASRGGANHGTGTVFAITPSGSFRRLYSFCSQGVDNCADGTSPTSVLVQGTDNNFYGTTELGGTNGSGTVFKITPTGTLTTLYTFCSQGGENCTDGEFPVAGLVQGTDGNFYGTTTYGGANDSCEFGCGTIFSITPTGALTTLHSFDDTDGATPYAALVQHTDGKFYGTTGYGGASSSCTGVYGQPGCGTVFSISVGLGPFVKTNPVSGNVGAAVTILGNNLTGATKVTFHGIAAAFTIVSSSEITTTIPAGATNGLVKVVTLGGTLSSNVPFRVTP